MQQKTRILLQDAMDQCDENNKSTEFMLLYMQDYAGVNLDCVLNFLMEKCDGKNKNIK